MNVETVMHTHFFDFLILNRKEGYSKQMEIKGSNFTAFFDSLTKNTSVLLIISDTDISNV